MQQRRTALAWARSVAFCAALAVSAGCVEPSPEPPRQGLARDLYAGVWLDPQTAVAVGARGTVRRSENAGGSWETLSAPVRTGLYDVAFADTQRGWAVGQRSVLLRTDDGGRSWVSQTHPRAEEGLPLLAVHALDRERAVAVGAWGARIVTRDGGAHWEDHSLVVTPENPRFAWLDEADQERARAGERIYDDVTLQDVTCRTDPERCWIVGEFGHLLSSEGWDGAIARGRIDTGVPVLRLGFAADTTALTATNAERLAAWIAALKDEAGARIELGWTLGPEARALRDLPGAERALEDAEARLATVRGALLDAGWEAQQVRERTPIPWELLEAPDALRAVTGGLGGRARERAEVTLALRAEPMLFAVDLASAERGLAVGGQGVWLRTTDGGAHWRLARLDGARALFAVTHGAEGWPRISGADGVISSWGSSGWYPIIEKPGFVRDLVTSPDGARMLVVGEAGVTVTPVIQAGQDAVPAP